MKKITLVVAIFLVGLGVAHTVPAEDQAPAVVAEESAASEANLPGTPQQEDQPVTVMDTPLDGSSVETFTAGLEKIGEEGSEEEYRQVMSALDFLLFYDIGARRKKDLLYARLDGMTPNQILDRVKQHRTKPAKRAAK